MILTIGFSSPKKFNIISKIIQTVIGETYSHTYFKYLDVVTGDEMIIEASHGEVHEEYYPDWQKRNSVKKEFYIEVDDSKCIEFHKYINRSLNKPYKYTMLVGILIERVLGIDNTIGNEEGKFICSELVARGVGVPYKKWITPEQIEKYLIEMN